MQIAFNNMWYKERIQVMAGIQDGEFERNVRYLRGHILWRDRRLGDGPHVRAR
jgi:hypothetical protein